MRCCSNSSCDLTVNGKNTGAGNELAFRNSGGGESFFSVLLHRNLRPTPFSCRSPSPASPKSCMPPDDAPLRLQPFARRTRSRPASVSAVTVAENWGEMRVYARESRTLRNEFHSQSLATAPWRRHLRFRLRRVGAGFAGSTVTTNRIRLHAAAVAFALAPGAPMLRFCAIAKRLEIRKLGNRAGDLDHRASMAERARARQLARATLSLRHGARAASYALLAPAPTPACRHPRIQERHDAQRRMTHSRSRSSSRVLVARRRRPSPKQCTASANEKPAFCSSPRPPVALPSPRPSLRVAPQIPTQPAGWPGPVRARLLRRKWRKRSRDCCCCCTASKLGKLRGLRRPRPKQRRRSNGHARRKRITAVGWNGYDAVHTRWSWNFRDEENQVSTSKTPVVAFHHRKPRRAAEAKHTAPDHATAPSTPPGIWDTWLIPPDSGQD